MLPCKNAKLKNMLLLHDSSETAQRFFRQGFNLDKQKALEAEHQQNAKNSDSALWHYVKYSIYACTTTNLPLENCWTQIPILASSIQLFKTALDVAHISEAFLPEHNVSLIECIFIQLLGL